MTKPVTIDQISIKEHQRYAEDQKHLDLSFIKESPLVAPHPGITGTSAIYSSKWEELFEIQKKNLPWAQFMPPEEYFSQANRFFSYVIIPSILVDDNQEEGEKSNDEEDEEIEDMLERKFSVFMKIIKAKKHPDQSNTLFERDKTSILNLLDELKRLNKLLAQINSRKLQYQKG